MCNTRAGGEATKQCAHGWPHWPLPPVTGFEVLVTCWRPYSSVSATVVTCMPFITCVWTERDRPPGPYATLVVVALAYEVGMPLCDAAALSSPPAASAKLCADGVPCRPRAEDATARTQTWQRCRMDPSSGPSSAASWAMAERRRPHGPVDGTHTGRAQRDSEQRDWVRTGWASSAVRRTHSGSSLMWQRAASADATRGHRGVSARGRRASQGRVSRKATPRRALTHHAPLG